MIDPPNPKEIREKKREEFCKCKRVTNISSEVNDFGFWDICNTCGKVIEDSFQFFNHYDGEDHCLIDD